jgi:hypothetical protein
VRPSPRPTHRLPLGLLLGLSAVLLTLAGGCARTIEARPAWFRVRPDSVDAGDLRGPFTGKVLDAANRTPVSGAVVYAVWTLERGSGLPTLAGYREALVSTDTTGAYTIPALRDAPTDARVTDVTLVIYKSGFVGYRSDRRFDDLGARRDFAQQRHEVLLDRWRPEYSHARHVRFLGGGEAIAALTSWELDEAAAELSAGRRGTDLGRSTSGPYLVAAQLLSGPDIKTITGYEGAFESGPLEDEPDTSVYSSQHFKALGRNATYDVAIRMWRGDADASLERYQDLVAGLPSVDQRDEIATRSFRTADQGVRGVGFLDGKRGLVVLITCGENQCATDDQAVALAAQMAARAEALWTAAGGTTPGDL